MDENMIATNGGFRFGYAFCDKLQFIGQMYGESQSFPFK